MGSTLCAVWQCDRAAQHDDPCQALYLKSGIVTLADSPYSLKPGSQFSTPCTHHRMSTQTHNALHLTAAPPTHINGHPLTCPGTPAGLPPMSKALSKTPSKRRGLWNKGSRKPSAHPSYPPSLTQPAGAPAPAPAPTSSLPLTSSGSLQVRPGYIE